MSLRLAAVLLLSWNVAATAQTAVKLHRLDGSKISVVDAEAFAQKTLAATHVTGAELAFIRDGKLVWSYGYGLRHKSPDLPMTPDTNTWAASITTACDPQRTPVFVRTERSQEL